MIGILLALAVLVLYALWLVFCGRRLYAAYTEGRIKDAIFWGIAILLATR